MVKSIVTPLVGIDCRGDNTFAYYLEDELKKKCLEYENLLVNKYTRTIPKYYFLKTNGGECFGIVVHKQQRFTKANILHKHGYKSHRISYPIEDLDNGFLHYVLHTRFSKMNPKIFTKIEAFSLKDDYRLVQIGEFSYRIDNNKNSKEAYIDGVYVDRKYRGMGISRAIQDYAHLCFAKEGVNTISADLMKIDIEYSSAHSDPYRDPYTPYFNMLVGCPRERVSRGKTIRCRKTESYGYVVESEKRMRDHFTGTTPVRAEMKNIKLNPQVIIPSVEHIMNDYYTDSIM